MGLHDVREARGDAPVVFGGSSGAVGGGGAAAFKAKQEKKRAESIKKYGTKSVHYKGIQDKIRMKTGGVSQAEIDAYNQARVATEAEKRREKLISKSPSAKLAEAQQAAKEVAEKQRIASAMATRMQEGRAGDKEILRQAIAGTYVARPGQEGQTIQKGDLVYGGLPSEKIVSMWGKLSKEEKGTLATSFGAERIQVGSEGTVLWTFPKTDKGDKVFRGEYREEIRLTDIKKRRDAEAAEKREKILTKPIYDVKRIKEEFKIRAEKAKEKIKEFKERPRVTPFAALKKLPSMPTYKEATKIKVKRETPWGIHFEAKSTITKDTKEASFITLGERAPKVKKFSYGLIRGEYMGIKEEPEKAAIMFGAGFLLAPGLKYVGKGAKKVAKVTGVAALFGKIPKKYLTTKPFELTTIGGKKLKVPAMTTGTIAEKGVGVGLTGLYTGEIARRVSLAETPEAKGEVFGRAISTELAPMGLGAATYYKGAPKVTGFFKKIGKKEVKPPIPPKTLAGKEQFPTAPIKEHRRLFEEQKYRLPGEKRFHVYKAVEEKWAKKTEVGAGAYEVPGASVAPFISPHFLRIQGGKGYNLFGLGLPKGLGSPTAMVIFPKGLRTLPGGVGKTAKQLKVKGKFLREKAEKGYIYVSRLKSEVEGIVTPKTPLLETRKRFYFKEKGHIITEPEYEVLGGKDIKKLSKKERKRVKTYGDILEDYRKAYGNYSKDYKPSLISPYGLPYYKKVPTRGYVTPGYRRPTKPYKVTPYERGITGPSGIVAPYYKRPKKYKAPTYPYKVTPYKRVTQPPSDYYGIEDRGRGVPPPTILRPRKPEMVGKKKKKGIRIERERLFRYSPSLTAIERKRLVGKAPKSRLELGLRVRPIYETKRKRRGIL